MERQRCHGFSYSLFWIGIRIQHSSKPNSDGDQWANDERDRNVYTAVGNAVCDNDTG